MSSVIFADNRDHSVRVSENRIKLDLASVWLSALTDTKLIHRSWIKASSSFRENYLRVISFRSFLHRFRRNTDKIVSRYDIALPFLVKNELSITKRNASYLK